jgi:hypothetical protein
MLNNFQLRDFTRCSVCARKFGLVRYYACQTAICSKRCAGRLTARRESDRRWLMSAAPIAAPHDSFCGPVDVFETYQGMPSLNL